MFPNRVDTFVHGIHRKIWRDHEVWRMWHEYWNHSAIRHQHNALRIPMLWCTNVRATNPFCLVDVRLGIIGLKGIANIALQSNSERVQDYITAHFNWFSRRTEEKTTYTRQIVQLDCIFEESFLHQFIANNFACFSNVDLNRLELIDQTTWSDAVSLHFTEKRVIITAFDGQIGNTSEEQVSTIWITFVSTTLTISAFWNDWLKTFWNNIWSTKLNVYLRK